MTSESLKTLTGLAARQVSKGLSIIGDTMIAVHLTPMRVWMVGKWKRKTNRSCICTSEILATDELRDRDSDVINDLFNSMVPASRDCCEVRRVSLIGCLLR